MPTKTIHRIPKIGVLALQGDFAEHIAMLKQLDVDVVEVRKPSQLADLDGLILPGGESTTFRILAERGGLMTPLREFALDHPTWGTCAGAIMLAKHIVGQESHLNVMDITVERNAFGRQTDSFTAPLAIKGMRGGDYDAVFIRAPIIREVGDGVQILSTLTDGTVVAAQQGHLLATSFHPELTPDTRMHAYFVKMVTAN